MDTKQSPFLLGPEDVGGEIRPSWSRTFIEAVVFSNYTEAEHRCTIVDGEGRIVFDFRGVPGLDQIKVEFPCTVAYAGLRLQQLDSGNCQIHIR